LFLSPDRVELEERSLERARSPVQEISLTANITSAFPQYLLKNLLAQAYASQHWRVLLSSLFLVSVPVFFEAPLVRYAPWLSLICSVGWLAIAEHLQLNPKANSESKLWGSLIWGFSLTWLCGSLYWGWLRWEPACHVPVEALALPWAIWATRQDSHRVGGLFYIGSLFGTAITDLYFYIAHLFPNWKALMQVESNVSLAQPILKNALTLVETPWGMTWACILAALLLIIGNKAMRLPNLAYWAFGGAVLGTIFVDLLFFSLAILG
jgi:CDP-diglyceride synthetase